MEELIRALLDYGLAGIGIIGLSFYIRYSLKEQEKTAERHSVERNEWKLTQDKQNSEWLKTARVQFDKLIEVSTKSNELVDRNTQVVAEFRGVMSSIDKRVG